MIDLHSHIIFAADDGAKNIEESLEMAAQAVETGYTKILCTPHFRYPRFKNEGVLENFQILKEKLEEGGVPLEILLGNELYLAPENIQALGKGQVNPIEGTSYILVEAAPSMPYRSYAGALAEIEALGYKPVLAHIERYFFSLGEIRELYEKYPVQVNISSVNLDMKKRIRILAQEGLIDILATDSHGKERRNYRLSGELEVFREILGEERFRLLTQGNPERILKDEKIIKSGGSNGKHETSCSSRSFIGRVIERISSRIRIGRDS